jgi:hypothetical protein
MALEEIRIDGKKKITAAHISYVMEDGVKYVSIDEVIELCEYARTVAPVNTMENIIKMFVEVKNGKPRTAKTKVQKR